MIYRSRAFGHYASVHRTWQHEFRISPTLPHRDMLVMQGAENRETPRLSRALEHRGYMTMLSRDERRRTIAGARSAWAHPRAATSRSSCGRGGERISAREAEALRTAVQALITHAERLRAALRPA